MSQLVRGSFHRTPRRGCTQSSLTPAKFCLRQRRLDATTAGSTVPLLLRGAVQLLHAIKSGSTVLLLLHGAVNLDAVKAGSSISRHAPGRRLETVAVPGWLSTSTRQRAKAISNREPSSKIQLLSAHRSHQCQLQRHNFWAARRSHSEYIFPEGSIFVTLMFCAVIFGTNCQILHGKTCPSLHKMPTVYAIQALHMALYISLCP
jgi:hypothetical protein